MSEGRPLIIAVMSGKGGVGKTMLTSAIAENLSKCTRTLVVDLDFFNRGISGLFAEGREVLSISAPAFLSGASADHPAEPWDILEVAPDLFHAAYADLKPGQLAELEACSPSRLRDELEVFLQGVCGRLQIGAVVLDCHGGPDRTSFAAAWLARHAILVSEPDRITLHGTLNFLRQMEHTIPEAKPDVRLVFNKVGPSFSTRFLQRVYASSLRSEFGGHALLAALPIEPYLAKEFEKTPLTSAAFPYSQLSLKTQILLLDLLGVEYPQLVPPELKAVPGWLRRRRRASMGRLVWWLDPNCATMLVIGSAMMIAVQQMTELHAEWLHEWLAGVLPDMLDEALPVMLLIGGSIWFLMTFMLGAARWLERQMVRCCRTGLRGRALFYALVLGGGLSPLVFLAAMATEGSYLAYYAIAGVLFSPMLMRMMTTRTAPHARLERWLRGLLLAAIGLYPLVYAVASSG